MISGKSVQASGMWFCAFLSHYRRSEKSGAFEMSGTIHPTIQRRTLKDAASSANHFSQVRMILRFFLPGHWFFFFRVRGWNFLYKFCKKFIKNAREISWNAQLIGGRVMWRQRWAVGCVQCEISWGAEKLRKVNRVTDVSGRMLRFQRVNTSLNYGPCLIISVKKLCIRNLCWMREGRCQEL